MGRSVVCQAALAVMVVGTGASAQNVPPTSDWPVTGLRTKLGSSATRVQQSYNIAGEPRRSLHRADQLVLEAPSEGLLFTFNASRCLVSIRLSDGFAGSVAGVSMHDTLAVITAKLDQPVRQPLKSGHEKAYVYDIAQTVSARFDVSLGGDIKRIYLLPTREAGEPRCGAGS